MSLATSREQAGEYIGTAIPLEGDDIDTDRILPARYLKNPTFEGLGKHLFEDARAQNSKHPFDQKEYANATVLVAGRNFGCGSSREHAPRALGDWGVKAIVAASFAEIFIGNCTSIGVPCFSVEEADAAWLRQKVARHPGQLLKASLATLLVTFLGREIAATLPEGMRKQLLDGTWDVTGLLLQAGDAIERTASALPYFKSYRNA
jgi:3-isopropylmalate/(R)-2-methylmalate dehydratase small subunit